MCISDLGRKWLTRGLSLVFSGALFLLGVETGYYLKINQSAPSLVVEIQKEPPKEGPGVMGAATAASPAASLGKDCLYVGSRNSDLYHLPTCAVAKRIKPENIVCFESGEAATQKGYRPGCLE